MIDLERDEKTIREFVIESIGQFFARNPSTETRHVALYSSPWSGWVVLCANSEPMADQNCPDFAYPEIATLENESWVDAYETEDPLTVRLPNGELVDVDVEQEGDEALNQVFFGVLNGIMRMADVIAALDLAPRPIDRVGVQMLDSKYSKSWDLYA